MRSIAAMATLLLVFVLCVTTQVSSFEATTCPYFIPAYPYTASSACLYGCCADQTDGCCPEPFYESFGFIVGMGCGCPILLMTVTGTIIYFVCRKRYRARAAAAAAAAGAKVRI